MKILELNYASTWRGGERQTIYNGLGFIARGHQVGLVCRKGTPLEKKGSEAGFKIHSFTNIFGVLSFLIFQGRKYDLFHAQTSQILTYCLLTKPFHGNKTIFTRRLDFVPKGLITRIKYQLTDYRVGISLAVKRIMEDFCERKIFLISEIAVEKPLDRGRVASWMLKKGLTHEKAILATTSALVQHKDPLSLVNAIGMMNAERNDFLFLHFGDGYLRPQVEARIRELHLEDVFLLCGFEDHVEDFFSIFDVFVMSSEEEGLGSSVLDAFLYKVPLVSTNAGGLDDLLQDGRGISCKVHDPASLASGMNFVLDNPEAAAACAENAFNYVRARNSSETITDQYLALLNETGS